MARTLKEFVNYKFNKLKQVYLGIEHDEECIKEEIDDTKHQVTYITRNKQDVRKCERLMAITLACGIGLGIVEVLVLDKIKEKKLYHTYTEVLSEDNTTIYDEDYQDKINNGSEVYLIKYEPWMEADVTNTFGKKLATRYEKNTYLYDVSTYDYEVLSDYFNIDLSNIDGELIDSETRYILPSVYNSETIWEVKRIVQPNLDDFLVVNEALSGYEKGLFTLIFIISLGVPAIITFYLLIIIKTIVPNIRENKELQEKLLNDLEVLKTRLNNTQFDKEEILGELLAIKDKYLDLIEDQEFVNRLTRTN